MSKRTKRILVTICVIAGVVIAASVILRLVLTKEKLTAMVVPRIEARTGAEIEFSDIGIRFPFGFGVRIDGLKVSRDMPGQGSIDVTAANLNVDVSLMSLIRRKPEIKSVTLGGAAMLLSGMPPGKALKVEDLSARLSMSPVDTLFVLDPRISAGRIIIDDMETGEIIELPSLSFSGKLEAPASLTRASVSEGKLSIAELAALTFEGDIADLRGKKEFTLSVRSSGLEARQLLDLLLDKGLVELPEDGPEFTVESGTVGLDARAAGMAADPGGISLGGDLSLEGVTVSSPGKPQLAAGGSVSFSNTRISSESLSLETPGSRAVIKFAMELDEKTMKPGMVTFDTNAKVDLAEAAAFAPVDGDAGPPEPVAGTLKAEVKGGALPSTLKNLFPPDDSGATPGTIAGAWKALDLKGAVELSAEELPGEDGPGRITALKTRATIDGGSVKDIEASFDMGGRPWKVRGDMNGIMPAFSELVLAAKKDALPPNAGQVLDGLVNSPDMSIYVEGRAFDAAAFQEAAAGETLSADKSSGGGGAPMEKQEMKPLIANPATLLMLKKTFVSVKIDSIITKGAVFTSLDARGRISNGVLRAEPVTVKYAGGTGRGRLLSDLREPSRIRNDIDIDFSGIDAGKALSGFHSAGGLVTGTFAMKLDGRFIAGPDQDILQNLTATGRATSTSGTLDFSRFMAPIKAAGLNITSIERFDFHEWTEKFVIENGRVSSEVWRIASKNGDWDISGSFGFDGTLDYSAGLVISPAQQARMKDLAKYAGLIDLFKDDQGNILLNLHIGGTSKSPKVRLDQSRAREKAGKKLLDGAKDKLKDLFK
jgi:hypothetical protein